MTGPVTAFVREAVAQRLTQHGVVVWYDADRDFHALAASFAGPRCTFIDASGSELAARRAADAAARAVRTSVEAMPPTVIVYVPTGRSTTDAERLTDPFEGLARSNGAFGGTEAESFQQFVRLALPGREAEVAALFATGRPSLAVVDALVPVAANPRVALAFGSANPADVAIAAICDETVAARVAAQPGTDADVASLLGAAIGLPRHPAGEAWADWVARLASFVVWSDFAADVGAALPDALASVPRAPEAAAPTVRAIVAGLASRDGGREAIEAAARETSARLGLPAALGTPPPPTAREHFDWQADLALHNVIGHVVAGRLDAAHEILAMPSPWRAGPERHAPWQVVRDALGLLETIDALAPRIGPSVRAHVDAYVAVEGRWLVDRRYRDLEHRLAISPASDAVKPLVDHWRARYREAIAGPQATFQAAVDREAWPPEGYARTTETFERFVTPEVAAGRRVAYYLVDAMRYEMGRALEEVLADLGSCTVTATMAQVPTTTPVGMAALLPGAKGSFRLKVHNESLVPVIGDRTVEIVADRIAAFVATLGTQVVDVPYIDLLRESMSTLRHRVEGKHVAVVRVQEIDDLGESQNQLRAWREMTKVMQDLRSVAMRLVDLGFTAHVFASDHGHVQFADVLPSDAVASPDGEWLLAKRRVRLGTPPVHAPGVLVVPPDRVGVDAPVSSVAFARGFHTYERGTGYFHEGLSLQECVLPVVSLRAAPPKLSVAASDRITLTYPRDRFTSSVISVKVGLMSLLNPTLRVRVEAYDGTGLDASMIASAAECDGLDVATREVMLDAGREVSVPLLIPANLPSPSIEIRVTDPRTLVTYQRKTLTDMRLD
jgi:hypothetical protein